MSVSPADEAATTGRGGSALAHPRARLRAAGQGVAGLPDRIPPRARPPMAWGVHLLTASGVVVGLLALLATVDGRPRQALGWLVVALAIDGLDGPLARILGTRTHAPKVDGMVLDLVVDYIPYVVVPALFLVQFEMLPAPVAVAGAAFVMFTSLYCFARADMKARDQYFVGFPATWNLVVFVLYLLGTPTWLNVVAVVGLGALTFTRIKFVHPVRVRELRRVTLPVIVLWLGTMVYLIVVHPEAPAWARAVVVAGVAYQALLTVRRTLGDRRR
ncbi:MAG TPA: CDP-alcohol phosphatidyltransferase family protein [Mycobacteriales bacterium]|nr:phosphatidyl choline synthase [Cryptosporangiaceae bacterium]MDQ1678035.1 phosphatidylcholine synthase [Actinomycetota bacterium]HEV7754419.1 CDP-alcohol phosphatidyltransferase family protein [Mycobacteriales bacterium]